MKSDNDLKVSPNNPLRIIEKDISLRTRHKIMCPICDKPMDFIKRIRNQIYNQYSIHKLWICKSELNSKLKYRTSSSASRNEYVACPECGKLMKGEYWPEYGYILTCHDHNTYGNLDGGEAAKQGARNLEAAFWRQERTKAIAYEREQYYKNSA